MKYLIKNLLTIMLLAITSVAFSQTPELTRSSIEARQWLRVNNKTIIAITDDTTAANQNSNFLMTEQAVKRLIQARTLGSGGGGISYTSGNGIKIDGTRITLNDAPVGSGSWMFFDSAARRYGINSNLIVSSFTNNTPASTDFPSLIVGNNNTTANQGIAVGTGNNISGTNSVVIGNSNSVSGNGSIGIGGAVNVSGSASISVGNTTSSLQTNSSSFGLLTIADRPEMMAIGSRNDTTGNGSNQVLFQVGNSYTVSRSNVFTIGRDYLHINLSSKGAGKVLTSDANGRATWEFPAGSGGTASWSVNGNAGTNTGTDFIGTTDNTALNFRVNNVIAGYIDNVVSAGNTSFGYNAMPSTGRGSSNTALGHGAYSGIRNTDVSNTFVGSNAGFSNTNGLQKAHNVAIGTSVLLGIEANNFSLGSRNIAIGTHALRSTGGSANIAIGVAALRGLGGTNSNNQDSLNIAIGDSAMSASGGSATAYSVVNNIAIGKNAAIQYIGTENVIIGNNAQSFRDLNFNGNPIRNVGIGHSVLVANTTGANNVAVGANAASNQTTGSSNIAIGSGAEYPSGTASGQLSIQNIIYGTGNTGTGQTLSTGNIGIGTNAPNASALLDLTSTSRGVLFPRMTEAQRLAIASPATGLIVYQTDATEGVYVRKSTGWVFAF